MSIFMSILMFCLGIAFLVLLEKTFDNKEGKEEETFDNKEEVKPTRKDNIYIVTGVLFVIVAVGLIFVANENANEQYKEALYIVAAEQGINQETADYIYDNYGDHRELKHPKHLVDQYIEHQAEINAAKERIELLKQALKVHNKEVANAEGKLTGDLSCYTIAFIRDMTEQAEQTGTIIDLDCESSVINKEHITIEERIKDAERDLAYAKLGIPRTIQITPAFENYLDSKIEDILN